MTTVRPKRQVLVRSLGCYWFIGLTLLKIDEIRGKNRLRNWNGSLQISISQLPARQTRQKNLLTFTQLLKCVLVSAVHYTGVTRKRREPSVKFCCCLLHLGKFGGLLFGPRISVRQWADAVVLVVVQLHTDELLLAGRLRVGRSESSFVGFFGNLGSNKNTLLIIL